MKKIEWVREALSAWPSAEHLNQREAAGWRMVAVEWEREVQVEPAAASTQLVPARKSPTAPASPAIACTWKRIPPKCKSSITWPK